jgi:hypothetical protein
VGGVLVDATLLKGPLEFLLKVQIKSPELAGTHFECPRSTKKMGLHLRTDVETAALVIYTTSTHFRS